MSPLVKTAQSLTLIGLLVPFLVGVFTVPIAFSLL